MKRKAIFMIKTQKSEMENIDLESAVTLLGNEIAALMCDGENDRREDGGASGTSDIFAGTGVGDGCEVYEFMTEGYVLEGEDGMDADRVCLTYEDTELTGMQGSRTQIIFDRHDPSFVWMLRDGQVKTSMSFDVQKQHITSYSTPYMNFEVYINTLSVDNRFDTDREIRIDYLIDLRGLSVSRNILTISVKYDGGDVECC